MLPVASTPLVVGMLHNYGGNRGLYGNLSVIANGPVEAMQYPNVTMVATVITPEAIEQVRMTSVACVLGCLAFTFHLTRWLQNPIMYELMTEMGWRSASPDVEQWVQQYAARRYGGQSQSASTAWSYLLTGTYNQNGIDRTELERVPSVDAQMSRNANATAITNAWRFLVQAANNREIDVSVGPFQCVACGMVPLSRA